ncbi:MAG: FtsX-like permease family protein [Candidatus Latescibacteria bacterium]|nr:FtsX-like permease family protein [Candidatus Latescibacterota bacterium]
MKATALLVGILSRDLRRRPLGLAASALSIAAGIAVIVAIYQVGLAARSSFRSSFVVLAGRTTHQLSADNGLPQERLAALKAHPDVTAAQPVIEGLVPLLDYPGKPLRLVGLDPFQWAPFLPSHNSGSQPGLDIVDFVNTPGGVYLSAAWTRSQGVQTGQALQGAAAGYKVSLQVLGTYSTEQLGAPPVHFALADIATAQEVLDRLGRIDRIDLILTSNDDGEIPAIALLPGERLERPAQRGERAARMLDAFRFNLLILGALALFVGCFLVYNAAEFAAIRREPLLAQLRSLGATRGQVLGAVLCEAALLGAGGSLMGLFGGHYLAHFLVDDLAQSITALYGFVEIDLGGLNFNQRTLLTALGTAVALIAALFPARDAASVAPRLAGFRPRRQQRFVRQRRRLCGLVLAALALVAASLALPTQALWPAYLAALGLLAANALLVPLALDGLLPRLQRRSEEAGHLLPPLALSAVHATLSRSGPAAGALSGALAMTLGVVAMVASFEREVQAWVHNVIQADIYISPYARTLGRETGRVPPQVAARLQAMPQVAVLETMRGLELPLGPGTVFVSGVEQSTLTRKKTDLLAGALPQLEKDPGQILVSEPMATHHRLAPGDTLVLEGPLGRVAMPIAGIFRDFSSDRGYVMAHTDFFSRRFGDTGLRSLALFLTPGSDAQALAQRLQDELATDYALDVRSHAQLRQRVFDVFEQTFAVTYLLETIATALALVGLAATLLGLFLEQSQQLAVWRALGANLGRVRQLFALEALILAGAAFIAAVPTGAALALLLTEVVNWRAFGWSIRFFWPWAPVLSTGALTLAAGLLAALAPYLLARRQSIAQALREE